MVVDESSERLAGWKDRWEKNMLGWHESTLHDVWTKHGERVIPQLFAKDEESCNAAPVSVLVTLCGKTVDMVHLATSPAVSRVIGVDGIFEALTTFASEQPQLNIREIPNNNNNDKYRRLVGNKIELLEGDFFELDTHAVGRVDVVFDRASLVAIDPELRKQYVDTIGKVLRPGGRILLVTIIKDKPGGPPHSVSEQDVRDLYENLPWVESITVLENEEAGHSDTGNQHTSLYFLIQAKEEGN